ncbi:hypothetical protein [Allofranklinella schreckenbergeri]|uniref:hypothetical protein n=1 Tax=Allofranklinella schreckenbergeri TaxID=1076744 RepID=UPI0011C3FD65|nr:hypothetical protein [Allofranklinella schreckenbergeri]
MNDGVDRDFANWALNYSGCDGGDWGDPGNPSIWVCGIEWGSPRNIDGNLDVDAMRECFRSPVNAEGYDNVEEQWVYSYNRACFKIFSAIHALDERGNGFREVGRAEQYKDFAHRVRPFVKGCRGYAKINLYPLAFRNIGKELWTEVHRQATKFSNKNDYVEWVAKNRFPVMRSWVQEKRPRLIICFGVSGRYPEDFRRAFLMGDRLFEKKKVDGCKFEIYVQYSDESHRTLVAVAPFPTSPSGGLLSNAARQRLGEFLVGMLNANN